MRRLGGAAGARRFCCGFDQGNQPRTGIFTIASLAAKAVGADDDDAFARSRAAVVVAGRLADRAGAELAQVERDAGRIRPTPSHHR